MKLGFIGFGNMAMALVAGFINSGKISGKDITAFAPDQDRLRKNADKFGIPPLSSARELVKAADTIIIACKPYQVESVLIEIRDLLPGKALISIALGWNFSRLSDVLGENAGIQFVMPNTPALTGEGVFLFEKENSLPSQKRGEIMELFKASGIVEELPTELMGIGGAITGCGPAFVDIFIEAYADAAVKYGIARDTAYRLVSATALGSAKLQLMTGEHPAVLKDRVCSPGGSTIRGVAALEREGLRRACQASIDDIMEM